MSPFADRFISEEALLLLGKEGFPELSELRSDISSLLNSPDPDGLMRHFEMAYSAGLFRSSFFAAYRYRLNGQLQMTLEPECEHRIAAIHRRFESGCMTWGDVIFLYHFLLDDGNMSKESIESDFCLKSGWLDRLDTKKNLGKVVVSARSSDVCLFVLKFQKFHHPSSIA